jgi:hypothetical protein
MKSDLVINKWPEVLGYSYVLDQQGTFSAVMLNLLCLFAYWKKALDL